MNDLNQVRLNTQMKDSIQFHNSYEEVLNEGISKPIQKPLLADLEELHASILASYSQLTGYQEEVLQNIFQQCFYIQETVDPKRIDNFSHHYNEEDEELLLYRKNEKGLINLIIHEEELFAFSYIDNANKLANHLTFYEEGSEIDYQKIVLKFFA